MTLSKAQENYEKRIDHKKGRSKWFGFVETRKKLEFAESHCLSRPKSNRGNTYMLAGGLRSFNQGS